ncbi:MAG: hypothetical protein HC899_00920 [Leptolyngbyaceae cyanobacterium SM1_4_3]|nr:hypothetical protein [Leptolyngbyaceae cyanobacterium SM1_4_3]NJN89050.1 hypothetical protein [Leptolyngbyaceae cyanobacterium SL_5_14]
MPRQKRSSRVLVNAERRAASLRSVSNSLDFGEGVSLADYTQLIEDLRAELATHNEALSLIDKSTNAIQDIESKLRDLSERLLLGVGTRYGKNSNEYEMAGGIRKSDRKRPTRRSQTDALG